MKIAGNFLFKSIVAGIFHNFSHKSFFRDLFSTAQRNSYFKRLQVYSLVIFSFSDLQNFEAAEEFGFQSFSSTVLVFGTSTSLEFK